MRFVRGLANKNKLKGGDVERITNKEEIHCIECGRRIDLAVEPWVRRDDGAHCANCAFQQLTFGINKDTNIQELYKFIIENLSYSKVMQLKRYLNVEDSESVLITKEEYEQLKEKAWQYDSLNK